MRRSAMVRGVGGDRHRNVNEHGTGGGMHLVEDQNHLHLHQQQDDPDNISDDDNAQQDAGHQDSDKQEDPFLLAVDDLEGRVVSALDDVKLNPGVQASSGEDGSSVHDELSSLLKPVVEVAAHTGPSIARTYYRGVGAEGIEASVEDVYQRVVSDLVLPVMLETAQSDPNPAKRTASLTFFRHLWKECHKAGSWLDETTTGPQAGPYGPGGVSPQQQQAGTMSAPAMKLVQKRRQVKRLARESEILRYWVQASIACTSSGNFAAEEEAEGIVASRGVIAASGSLRPSLKHIAQRIKDTDDRGANRLFGPVMKMIETVLKKLFILGSLDDEAVRSACIKFLEIVVLCCSRKPQDASSRRRGHNTMEDFSLEDLPGGHPIITHEMLESISDYAFTTLRGLTLMGGQVKLDVNLLSEMMLSGDGSSQVLSILKPAALAYLEIESSLPKGESDKDGEETAMNRLDRTGVEFDFLLEHKSYALTINAMAALASNRPVFFKEASTCLARRAMQPLVNTDGGNLSKPAVWAINSQLRASCLTLLRNALSVSTNSSGILHKALKALDMELQADKALSMSRKAVELMNAGRSARNRANMYYEWDASETDRVNKRQRADEDLAKMRAAKAARGLGHGIQLPTNMTDAVELVMVNLMHLPQKRPTTATTSGGSKARKVLISLDSVVDAVMTNGASLSQEEGRWYDRDGGSAWSVDLQNSNQPYELSTTMIDALKDSKTIMSQERDNNDNSQGQENPSRKRAKLFADQCNAAASDAIGRILSVSTSTRSTSLSKLGSQIAARLAFALDGIKPSGKLQESYALAKDSATSLAKRLDSSDARPSLQSFVETYPLLASSMALGATSSSEEPTETGTGLCELLLNEALLQTATKEDPDGLLRYDRSLDLFVATVVRAGELANHKPNDNDRKKAAAHASSCLQRDFVRLPRITSSSLHMVAAMCDIDDITRRAAEASRKSTQQESMAASAAAHAAKIAAEKRAKAALVMLRDLAFQRDVSEIRKSAVQCAVGVAAGRLPSSPVIQDQALKLTMNVLFTKNQSLSDCVVESAMAEIQRTSDDAVKCFDAIQKANKEAEARNTGAVRKKPLAPHSDEEKLAMDRMRKPAVLCLALCVRRPELIKKLFELSCLDKADVLSKTVRVNMTMLSRAAAKMHGSAAIALKVAEMTGPKETPMLLAFLENLAPSSDKTLPEQDVIDACFKIQELKADGGGNKDPRFLIPVVSSMKRAELVRRLAEFVKADDKIFLAALVRMGDRVGRQALLFRDEPDEANPALFGMTLCEQLVYLHKLDFAAANLPQRRYLAAIKLCLDDDEVYNESVMVSALDQMSGSFLTGADSLPLAFMRTCILVCTNHESLHPWICHVLLPRLVDGKIYEDARQWEGWMRCAHMLQSGGDPGVNSNEAIQRLPPEQLQQFQTRWAGR